MKPEISVVIPIFNEEKNIPILHKRLLKTLKGLKVNYEIIFINDGSKDHSLEALEKLYKSQRIKIINFTRNFGHMPALIAGLKSANGKKVVLMDADLQDPPETISELYKKSKKGFDIVYAVKEKRKEGPLKRMLFLGFYRILNRISTFKMPLDAGTFSILDGKVVAVLNSLPEKNKYLSGLRAWTGYSQAAVIYERAPRLYGKSKSLLSLFNMALDGMISFSYVPLRISSLLGFVFSSISFLLIIVVIIGRIFFNLGLVGWASTLSTILFIGGVQLMTLGVIGEYLARIYDEVKGRPEYIISYTKGFSTKTKKK